jgi:hypothetical protein
MKNFQKILSLVGLIMTISPSFFLFSGMIEIGEMKFWMGVGMLAWMLSAPFWVNKSSDQSQSK